MEPDLAAVPAPVAEARPVAEERCSTPDLCMRRLLGLPAGGRTATETSARKLAETSLLVSTVRCLLTYIVLPFVLPIIHVGAGVTPVIGVVLGSVAIVANVASVRRFWAADHRYRWHYTVLASLIVAMLVWLIVHDVLDLLG
ncbi:MAG: hypothetical protein ACO1PW_07315 [Actinomycetota bacterium]